MAGISPFGRVSSPPDRPVSCKSPSAWFEASPLSVCAGFWKPSTLAPHGIQIACPQAKYPPVAGGVIACQGLTDQRNGSARQRNGACIPRLSSPLFFRPHMSHFPFEIDIFGPERADFPGAHGGFQGKQKGECHPLRSGDNR